MNGWLFAFGKCARNERICFKKGFFGVNLRYRVVRGVCLGLLQVQ